LTAVKKCPRCLTVKPLDAFAIDRSRASGRMSACKVCDAARSRRYYAANGDKVRDRIAANARRRRAGHDIDREAELELGDA